MIDSADAVVVGSGAFGASESHRVNDTALAGSASALARLWNFSIPKIVADLRSLY